jgi:predicted nucleic acid-binding protein
MAVIVSDTTPLNYLILVEAVEILPRLYKRIIIPPAVRDELLQPSTPVLVKSWLAQPPPWLEVTSPSVPFDPALSHLDEGEIQAITLALENRANLLLLDERDGTIAARERGLTVIGTIGVLDRAATLGLIDLTVMFGRLQQTTFRCPLQLMETLLKQDAARKKNL